MGCGHSKPSREYNYSPTPSPRLALPSTNNIVSQPFQPSHSTPIQSFRPATNPLPTFPLQYIPRCRRCNGPGTRRTVGQKNPNGNVDRPFYICTACKEGGQVATYTVSTNGAYSRGWITWDDYRGVSQSNYHCDCGVVCRQDRTGLRSSCPGREFWTCASGACGYLSWREDGRTEREGGLEVGYFNDV